MKYLIFLFILIIANVNTLFSQSENEEQISHLNDSIYLNDSSRKIYSFVEVEIKPKFPGGDAELMKYFSSNFNFEQIQIEHEELYQYSTRVYIEFVIEEDGKISNVKAVENSTKAHPVFENSVIKTIESMPDWIPGMHNGVNVPVKNIIPVHVDLK